MSAKIISLSSLYNCYTRILSSYQVAYHQPAPFNMSTISCNHSICQNDISPSTKLCTYQCTHQKSACKYSLQVVSRYFIIKYQKNPRLSAAVLIKSYHMAINMNVFSRCARLYSSPKIYEKYPQNKIAPHLCKKVKSCLK